MARTLTGWVCLAIVAAAGIAGGLVAETRLTIDPLCDPSGLEAEPRLAINPLYDPSGLRAA